MFRQNATSDTKTKFDYFSAILLMLLDRLLCPKSKLRSYEEQKKYIGIEEIELHHLYRALDLIAEKKERMEEEIFNKNVDLFNTKIEVVLYDVTTFYFESVRQDTLRDFGFSKDCKTREVQVTLGLLVDMEGRPVGFDIFKGNTYEGKTLESMIEKIEKRFQIKRVIFIADEAMLSEENIEKIKERKYEYVIGARIKNMRKQMEEKILNLEGYETVSKKIGKEEEIVKYKEIELSSEEKLIMVWSKSRAEKDKRDRQRYVEKAKELLESGVSNIIRKRGALKYIEIKTAGAIRLDEERIKTDERWDGLYGVRTNNLNIPKENLIEYYHNLWKIEESFRIFKTHLETRPIFHWTPRRIKGHFVLCFIAFQIERMIEIELRKNNIEHSPERIREALDGLEVSEIEIEERILYVRSKVEGLSNEVLRCLKIKIPPPIGSREDFELKA